MDDSTNRLRYEIINFFLRECRPPTTQELTDKVSGSGYDVVRGLQKLEELHHLKLYDAGVSSPSHISLAHPFSHLSGPTPNLVMSGGRSWWTNCAWCAFGLASMLSPNEVTVNVLTASGEYARVHISNDQIIQDDPALKDYFSTFSAPPSTWWKGVRFACSGIQICTSREEANGWHQKHGFPHGDVITLDQLWKLSKVWYHDKASLEYKRKTESEKEELYKDIGLVSSYWSS